MFDTFHIQALENRFSGHHRITIDELHRFYREDEPNLKRSTLRWRIYRLINEGRLQRIKRGVYTLESEAKKEWRPEVSDELTNLYATVRDKFPYLSFSVWSTRWLLSSMHHLPAGSLTIVDTEKDSEEVVFHFISDTFDTSVWVTPSKKEMTSYVDWRGDNIIVKRLISQSPLQEMDGVQVPKLEKIIVDIFNDETVFQAFQGRELKTITQNLWDTYRVSGSTLKRYALRRNKWDKLKAALKRWELNENFVED